jgi:hypothetical protein
MENHSLKGTNQNYGFQSALAEVESRGDMAAAWSLPNPYQLSSMDVPALHTSFTKWVQDQLECGIRIEMYHYL